MKEEPPVPQVRDLWRMLQTDAHTRLPKLWDDQGAAMTRATPPAPPTDPSWL